MVARGARRPGVSPPWAAFGRLFGVTYQSDQHAQQQYGQPIPGHPTVSPPQPYAFQPPPRKKGGAGKVLLIVFAVIFVLCGGAVALVAVMANGASKAINEAASNPGGAAKPAAGKVGQPVRDGKFEFTVQSVKPGVAQVGGQYANKKAQGQFVLVTVVVKNVGKEAQTFDSSPQKGYGPDGAAFEADGAAALYANEESRTFLETINPGNQVTGVLVFDIPKTATLAKVELHDSLFSGGVVVDLT